MVISFCGNKDVFSTVPRIEERILTLINMFAMVKQPIDFYIGGLGDFDEAARRAALIYKANTPGSHLYFVFPRNSEDLSLKYNPLKYGYDRIIFNKPSNYSTDSDIVAKNKYLVDACDYLIAYVDSETGEEAEMLEYAHKNKKSVLNIAILA